MTCLKCACNKKNANVCKNLIQLFAKVASNEAAFLLKLTFCVGEKRQTIGLAKHNMDTTVYFVNKKKSIFCRHLTLDDI